MKAAVLVALLFRTLDAFRCHWTGATFDRDGLAAVLMRNFGTGTGRDLSPHTGAPEPVAVEVDSTPVLASVADAAPEAEPGHSPE